MAFQHQSTRCGQILLVHISTRHGKNRIISIHVFVTSNSNCGDHMKVIYVKHNTERFLRWGGYGGTIIAFGHAQFESEA